MKFYDSNGILMTKKSMRKNREKKTTHVEELFLMHIKKSCSKLPQKLWLTKSPCEECACRLLEAYAEANRSSRDDPVHPTIYIADIYTGSVAFSTNAPGVKVLINLMAHNFTFEVWISCTEVFNKIKCHCAKQLLALDQAVNMSEAQFRAKKTALRYQKEAERSVKQLEILPERLKACRDCLVGQEVSELYILWLLNFFSLSSL